MFTSHLTVSAAICAFAFATVAAQAEPLPSLGCYARAYDTAHLSAHKKQIVDKAWLSIETRKDTPPYPFLATLQFSTKGRGKAIFSTFGACKADRGALLCNASLSAEETDRCKSKNDGVHHCRIGYSESGSFRIAAQPEGVLVTVVERLEMPGPDAGGRASYLYLSPDNAENHAFLLQPADAKACK
ncbi:hypothetical protein IYX23_14675 [Methylocystis sp. L43]|jgi:hypothetical protein|uniref:hypothetical protein n=1 Tax=unclassified Methylocystis TaxID=2625913 RepID=UPI0018C2AD1F|nr:MULTISPECIES: hypothetical protein [unclassified Methylocystis]MBG0798910.1 hypothetical protein [Methylocystis sp. L43]MBG0804021.1 hypothetical protein [Methylocystis sp. H15]